jgi:hypothetical protein
MYFYAKVLTSGRIRLSREEMEDMVFDSLESAGVWLGNLSEKPQLIWGAGFCAREDDALPMNVPLPDPRTCSTDMLTHAVSMWEMMANHPSTTETCTETYVFLSATLADRKAESEYTYYAEDEYAVGRLIWRFQGPNNDGEVISWELSDDEWGESRNVRTEMAGLSGVDHIHYSDLPKHAR